MKYEIISSGVLMVNMETETETRHDRSVVNVNGASDKANRFRSNSNTLLKGLRKTQEHR